VSEFDPIAALEAWGLEDDPRVSLMPGQGHSSSAWLVETDGKQYVAKLIRDGRPYAEPGLRVARAVEEAGVSTGAPVLTLAGEVCVEAEVDGSACTLALLRFAAGKPLKPTHPDAASIAGGLLGRVHAVLLRGSKREWVPNDLLGWCEAHARSLPERQAAEALTALAAIREHQKGEGLTTAVVYGDPSPEIVVDDQTGEVALIDWGTPSWGPLVHDLACWVRYLGASWGSERSNQFVATYREHVELVPGELGAVPLCHELGHAVGLFPRIAS
jgi:Ser/Thr protein kinase RdoA (MazF antagonist)